MPGQKRQRSKTFARRLGKAERAKHAAELYVLGWTWERVAKEVGYADRSGARKAAMEWRNELPVEAQEELRRTLMDRAEHAYADACASRDTLKDPEKRIEADAKIARIVKIHGELGAIIKTAPPAIVTVMQAQSSYDTSRLTPEELAMLHALRAKLEGPSVEAQALTLGDGLVDGLVAWADAVRLRANA